MGLSPLYPALTIDLHVRTAFGPPPDVRPASSGPGKVRQLSGLCICAPLQIRPAEFALDRAVLQQEGERALPDRTISSFTFITHRLVSSHHNTRTYGKLHGSCFKTSGKRWSPGEQAPPLPTKPHRSRVTPASQRSPQRQAPSRGKTLCHKATPQSKKAPTRAAL